MRIVNRRQVGQGRDGGQQRGRFLSLLDSGATKEEKEEKTVILFWTGRLKESRLESLQEERIFLFSKMSRVKMKAGGHFLVSKRLGHEADHSYPYPSRTEVRNESSYVYTYTPNKPS